MTGKMTEWFQRLEQYPSLADWVAELRAAEQGWYAEEVRADLVKWKAALRQLPEVKTHEVLVEGGRLVFSRDAEVSAELLRVFHPWRKGPLQVGGVFIDTEWRSDWKWERVEKGVDLKGKKVLDIGCGNGYYLWRMLAAGAEWVLGVDPYLPYVMQFKVMQWFGGGEDRVTVLPIGVEGLPSKAPVFDTVFSMGILYHQKSPLEHLAHCRDLLSKGGEFILETIVLPPSFQEVTDCLVPEGRYAKMKNVYFLPSVKMLENWLRKVRFQRVEVLDFSKTTLEEQRRTEWMTFESLADFLKDGGEETVEGHPAPWRVVVRATL